MRIKQDNERDGTLSGFFSCGSAKKIGGSRASDLATLGVGWEERLFISIFLAAVPGSYFVAYY